MTTADYLAKFNLTIQDAYNFVMSHLGNPKQIYDVCKQFGVSNEMLSDIVGMGISPTQVRDFFNSFGLDGNALFAVNMQSNLGLDNYNNLDDVSALFSNLLTVNNESGSLSSASLKQQIISVTGESAYNSAFNPWVFDATGDGVINANDFGGGTMGNLAATQESVESIYYGTLISMLKSIDIYENQEMEVFVYENQLALANQEVWAINELLTRTYDVYKDYASPQLLSYEQIESAIVNSTIGLVGYANGDNNVLLSALLNGA